MGMKHYFVCYVCHRITGMGQTSTKCKPATKIYQVLCTTKHVTVKLVKCPFT